jgi:hypothetical protein
MLRIFEKSVLKGIFDYREWGSNRRVEKIVQ